MVTFSFRRASLTGRETARDGGGGVVEDSGMVVVWCSARAVFVAVGGRLYCQLNKREKKTAR